MGDTWLYGIAADPYRLSAFRELSRLRSSMEAELAAGSADNKRHADSGEAVMVEAFSRRLMKIPGKVTRFFTTVDPHGATLNVQSLILACRTPRRA